jgi:hypothetical protein
MQGVENRILPEMLKIIATGIPQGIQADRCCHVISILEPSEEACLQGLCSFIDPRDVDKLQKQGSSGLGSGILFFFIIFGVERSEILGHNRVTSLGMVFVVIAIPYTLLCAEAREVFVFLNFPSVATTPYRDISPPQISSHRSSIISSAIFHLQGERLSSQRALLLLRFCWFSSGNLRNEVT